MDRANGEVFASRDRQGRQPVLSWSLLVVRKDSDLKTA